MTFEEFKSDVYTEAKKRPDNWRLGQAVFNIIDNKYGVARIVQFIDKIDCFYNDDHIENFMKASYARYCQIKNNNYE